MLVKQTEKYFENHPSVNDGPISGPVRKFISCILQLDKVDFERAFIFKPGPLAEIVEQWLTLMSACSNPIMSYLLCRKYLCVAHLARTYLQPHHGNRVYRNAGPVTQDCRTMDDIDECMFEPDHVLSIVQKLPVCGTLSPNVSTTPLRQQGLRQCLPFSWTIIRSPVRKFISYN